MCTVLKWTLELNEISLSLSVSLSTSFIIQCATLFLPYKAKVTQSCPTLQPHGLYSPWNSPGQNTEVGSLSLLQGISQPRNRTQVYPHCRWSLYQLSHKGSPKILEWVACPFSGWSSWPGNWAGVSCIAGGFFTNWVVRETYKAKTPHSIGSQLLEECWKKIKSLFHWDLTSVLFDDIVDRSINLQGRKFI